MKEKSSEATGARQKKTVVIKEEKTIHSVRVGVCNWGGKRTRKHGTQTENKFNQKKESKNTNRQ